MSQWIKLIAAFGFIAATLGAHEIGTTRVSALFEDGRTFQVQIVTDAAALAEKLDSQGGGRLGASVASFDAARLQSTITGFDEVFRRRVKVCFDGIEVRPEIDYAVEPPVDATAAAAARIRLSGAIPAGARESSWNFGWTFATYALITRAGDATPVTEWLDGGQTSKAFNLTSNGEVSGGRVDLIARYLALGFTHIVPHGLDHILFVIGIYLLSRRARSVLLQVSAFTVAHSITLGLSMYGVVSLPSNVVEPLIAVSIAYVALENIFLTELKAWRVGLVFAFGLLHGLGFAGALREVGLPRSEFATALVMFNVGVEAGQLAVIAAAFLLVGWHFGSRDWYRRRVAVPASVIIACTAIYWTVERLGV